MKAEKILLATALDDVQAMAGRLTRHLLDAQENPTELYKIGLESVRFLLAVGDLLVGWRLLVGAEIAVTVLDSGNGGADRAFYEGKIAVASFFAKTVLPRLSADRAVLSEIDTSIMELDEAAF
ncbi:Acetyl-CoA dehydrogenase C-terminal like [Nocardia amikacinitolerans]|nr:Acetyl-CoA dehydrogenase C-terminal like [Nocardia amikacinitolerans]